MSFSDSFSSHTDVMAKKRKLSQVSSPIKTEPDSSELSQQPTNSNQVVIQYTKQEAPVVVDSDESSQEWPFETLCDHLCLNLFSPKWEVRHGAALGLRDIFKSQGGGAGKVAGYTREQMETARKKRLEDLALRLLCVLALDRFADFVSDQVVVPVRETCGQALGALLKWCDEETCMKVLQHGMLNLIEYSKSSSVTSTKDRWEIKFSGLVGLKYFFAVRSELVPKIIGGKGKAALNSPVFRAIVDGLADANDDVRSVSAATLIPIADILISHLSPDVLFEALLQPLWSALADLDDLSSSTSMIMDLLSKFMSDSRISTKVFGQVESLLPRLFPFIRHTISSVRISVLNTLSVLVQSFGGKTSPLVQAILNLIFQNFFLEGSKDIMSLTLDLWEKLVSSSPSFDHFQSWLSLLMTPIGIPLDPRLIGSVFAHDQAMQRQELAICNEDNILHGRLLAAEALGCCLPFVSEFDIREYLSSPKAYHRFISQFIVQIGISRGYVNAEIVGFCKEFIESGKSLLFHESFPGLLVLFQEVSVLLNQCREHGIQVPEIPNPPGYEVKNTTFGPLFTFQVAEVVLSSLPANVSKSRLETLYSHHLSVFRSIESRVFVSATLVLIQNKDLPEKLNPWIQSLMSSLKTETHLTIQQRVASGFTELLVQCQPQRGNVLDKILRNVAKLVYLDIVTESSVNGIQTYQDMMDSIAEENTKKRKRGDFKDAQEVVDKAALEDEESRRMFLAESTRRGAVLVFSELFNDFGECVLEKCPAVWDICSSSFIHLSVDPTGMSKLATDAVARTEIIRTLYLISSICKSMPATLLEKILKELFPSICLLLASNDTFVRYFASKAISALTAISPSACIQIIISSVIPLASDSSNVARRQGAIECIYHLVNDLGDTILPFVVFLIVPVLGRMSDPDEQIRFLATQIFASLVKLIPLESGIPNPDDIPQELVLQREEERRFLGQLVGTQKVEEFEMPIGVQAELRPYQKEGVSWLAFLKRYGLHGILCDGM